MKNDKINGKKLNTSNTTNETTESKNIEKEKINNRPYKNRKKRRKKKNKKQKDKNSPEKNISEEEEHSDKKQELSDNNPLDNIQPKNNELNNSLSKNNSENENKLNISQKSNHINDISIQQKVDELKTQSKSESRFHNDFTIIEELGQGGEGTVFKVKNRWDEQIYAIKCIKVQDQENEGLESLLREVKKEGIILSRMQSPYIVRYFQTWMENYYDNESKENSSEEEKEVSTLKRKLSFEQQSKSRLSGFNNSDGYNGYYLSDNYDYNDFELSIEEDDKKEESKGLGIWDESDSSKESEKKENKGLGIWDDDNDDSSDNNNEFTMSIKEVDKKTFINSDYSDEEEKSKEKKFKRPSKLFKNSVDFSDEEENLKKAKKPKKPSKAFKNSVDYSDDEIEKSKKEKKPPSKFNKNKRKRKSLLSKSKKKEINYALFIQMEFCDGETLREAIDKQKLDPETNWLLLFQILQGVAFIHSKNYIHRDLKPGNIFLVFEKDSKDKYLSNNYKQKEFKDTPFFRIVFNMTRIFVVIILPNIWRQMKKTILI